MEKILINNLEKTTSEIIIDYSLMDKLDEILKTNILKKHFLITNNTLAQLYPQILKKFNQDNIVIIKDGEKYKNYKTFNFIIEELLKSKIERKDSIVALGGGVVGDLAGFCASSILRGVELIQIPTTLLAMCDSSIGGKTGFNTKYGKNLVGSFYKAQKVLIDLKFLNTLSDYQFKCGMGEVLKYAFIETSCKADRTFDLIDILSNNLKEKISEKMNSIVCACAYLKASVVNNDEKESGLRKILNFGHTFAHPIETLTKYKKFSHGQAVAYGMKMASKLALLNDKIEKDYHQRIEFLIDKYELTPKKLQFNKKDCEKFVELMKQDKKVQNGKINLLLPVARSQVELFDNIDLPSIEVLLP